MANRTGTYVAFDGLGKIVPSQSDQKYYRTLQMWDANNSMDFQFVDSHDKTDAVRDTSKPATLKARIQERLRASKNVVVILSSDTRKSGSMLSYEIEQAVDTYKLPLIITYTDYNVVLHPNLLSDYWPNSLSSRIGNAKGNMIHIPFTKKPIMDAIPRFTVNDESIGGNMVKYSAQAYRNWELLQSWQTEQNYLKS